MHEADNQLELKIKVVRIGVWGQAIGFVVLTLILGLEDAPEYFSRVSVTNLIWPIIVILAMYTLRLDKVVARDLPVGFLTVLILLPSLVSTFGTLAGAVFFTRIPPLLSTQEDSASAVGLFLVFLVFACALALNLILALRLVRSVKGTAP